jgi:hypothetical protein
MMADCLLTNPSCFLHVNSSGLSQHATLQLLVLQGLANREHGPAVWVSGVDRFPGSAGIEWFPGSVDGRWGDWQPRALVSGLRDRWLETIVTDSARTAVLTTPEELLSQVRPLLTGGILYSTAEPHAMGVVLTLCGLDALLPVLAVSELPSALPIAFDARARFVDAAAAALYTGHTLLPRCNTSTLAVQAGTNSPFLADAVVSWRLAMFWMDDMCANATQRKALDWILEGSHHFDESPSVQYIGWFKWALMPQPDRPPCLTATVPDRHRAKVLPCGAPLTPPPTLSPQSHARAQPRAPRRMLSGPSADHNRL